MEKKKFVRTIEFEAIKFNKNEFPWHRSIQRQTDDHGRIAEYEGFFCIVPCDGIQTIRDGDWIAVDDMNNAKFVFGETERKMMGIEEVKNG